MSCVARMQWNVRAALSPSSALTLDAAFQQDGAAMETTTAETGPMKRTAVSSKVE